MQLNMPFLTETLPGIDGRIRVEPEDFFVEEIGVGRPSGRGDHALALIEKRGLSTPGMVRLIASRFGVSHRAIGIAGLKDAAAVTRQWVSVQGVDPARVEVLEHPQIRVIEVGPHGRKLRLGDHTGNRFRIRVRGSGEDGLLRARAITDVVQQRGMPNLFGPQRFGTHGRAHEIGRCYLFTDMAGALDRYLGMPSALETDDRLHRARRLYDEGDLVGAQEAFPASRYVERTLLGRLIEGGTKEEVFLSMSLTELQFQLSAYQSWLFNRILAERIPRIDEAIVGDIIRYHQSRFDLRVQNIDAVRGPIERFAASPTGPIFGYRMAMAKGEPGRIELEMMAREGLKLEQFRPKRNTKWRGARRSFRVRPERLRVEGVDGDVVLSFLLPKGVFATALLRELMRRDVR